MRVFKITPNNFAYLFKMELFLRLPFHFNVSMTSGLQVMLLKWQVSIMHFHHQTNGL